jgi:hypothetical protein
MKKYRKTVLITLLAVAVLLTVGFLWQRNGRSSVCPSGYPGEGTCKGLATILPTTLIMSTAKTFNTLESQVAQFYKAPPDYA